MAFTVEDGTGTDPLANSYCSVQEWKDYWVDVGYDFSAYSDPQIRAALVRATRYVEAVYRNDWFGLPLSYDQPLSFPRAGLYDQNGNVLEGIPANLKKAIHEYAKRALPDTAELLPDPADTDITGQTLSRVKKKVGPIETDVTYSSAGARLLKRYPAADKWLADFKPSGGGTIHA